MAKQSAGSLLSIFDLHESDAKPLYRQIYLAIREAILSGNLECDARLPSSRTLAAELAVSRNTVITAFEQLESEGFLASRSGSGTYVAYRADTAAPSRRVRKPSEAAAQPQTLALSRQGKAMMAARTPMALAGKPAAFSPGIPALDVFPFKRWNRCLNRAGLRVDQAALNYGRSEGHIGLRTALASYLATARGVRCSPEQILLVSGVQQGLDLITRLLVDPGDSVWLEEPGHPGARGVFIAAQAEMVPVPIDCEGIDVEQGTALCRDARLAYVTPSHQSPSGAIMSIQRRMHLLEWARDNDAWIIEDDYDSEFRYKGQPLAALQGLVPDARVLYLGTFSKVLAPGLRLAYLVVPESLVDVFAAGRRLLDTHTAIPLQIAMEEFIAKGYFSTHIRRMRQVYQQRQAILVEEITDKLDEWITVNPSASGMHLVGYLRDGDDKKFSIAAGEQQINVPPLSDYYLATPQKSGLLFGYACTPPQLITESVSRLQKIFSGSN